jgi:putative phage-type endonuclease
MTEHRRHRIPKSPVREEWLAARAPFIGASEVAALFDEHPFIAAGDLAVEKLKRIERAENPAMKRGVMLEEAVAQWWAAEHGIEVFEVEVLFMVDDVLIATLDRTLEGHEHEALEVKTTSQHVNAVERSWWWQVQAQMVAADLARVHVAVLDATLALQSFTVERDIEAGERIIDACTEFMTHIRAGEVPPELPYTYGVTQALYPQAMTYGKELDGHAQRVLSTLRTKTKQLAELSTEVDRLKGMLTNFIGEASEAMLDGVTVATWRAVTTRTIDAKRLRADLPHVADEYVRATTSRRLLLK